MKSFAHLAIWKQEIALIKEMYMLMRLLPHTEQFGLISQLQRSSVSIFANTVEGLSRISYKDKIHRYVIARGECSETHALLVVCQELQFLTIEQTIVADRLLQEIGMMLSGLIRKLESALP